MLDFGVFGKWSEETINEQKTVYHNLFCITYQIDNIEELYHKKLRVVNKKINDILDEKAWFICKRRLYSDFKQLAIYEKEKEDIKDSYRRYEKYMDKLYKEEKNDKETEKK